MDQEEASLFYRTLVARAVEAGERRELWVFVQDGRVLSN